MIRVLQIIGSLERGGAETFLINLYRHIDRSKIQFDFVIYDEPSENGYYQEVIALGGKVFKVPPKSKGIFKSLRQLKKIIKENSYKSVWRYTESCYGAIDLIIAKSSGVSDIVLNSRSSYTDSILQRIIHYMIKPFLPFFVSKNYACGELAGKWMFGKHSFEVMDNGIEVDDFRYDEEVRNRHWQEFQLQDKIVIGHVGRFHPVKNHKLIIDVFEKLKERVPESVLVLVGEGELLPQIKELVKEKHLENDVLFLGSRRDVPEMLHMMDLFIMPSLFEGFPRAFLEAQAAGLPCVVSSTISKEVDVTGNVSFVELDAPVELWADQIIQRCGSKKEDNVDLLKEAGYNIKDVAMKIEKNILETYKNIES